MILRLAPILLLPAVAGAETSPEAILDFAEAHCLRIDRPATFYDLPDGWTEQRQRGVEVWLPTKAIEEGIDYAGFITWQSEVALVVELDRAWPLTVQAFEDQMRDERAFALRYGWTKLFIHDETDAHLFVSAGDDVDDMDALHEPTCYLWHPEAGHPLNAAIEARWDVPFGHRFTSGMGSTTWAWNHVSINGQPAVIETRVIRPNTEFTDGLAPVVLKLEVRGW